MKCIVTETSPERINAKPVTNEDGTPHVYATISEARAELKANGYSYNRANNRYYIKGTEYRAYIIREDSEEYAHTMEQAERQAERAEIIAELVSDPAAREMYIAPAPTYQRCELEAFLGEPDDYDMDAIEAEATAYDYSTGRTYWIAFGDDLAAIAERHELYSYAPAI